MRAFSMPLRDLVNSSFITSSVTPSCFITAFIVPSKISIVDLRAASDPDGTNERIAMFAISSICSGLTPAVRIYEIIVFTALRLSLVSPWTTTKPFAIAVKYRDLRIPSIIGIRSWAISPIAVPIIVREPNNVF